MVSQFKPVHVGGQQSGLGDSGEDGIGWNLGQPPLDQFANWPAFLQDLSPAGAPISGQTILFAPDGGAGSAAKAGGSGLGGGTAITSVASSASPFVVNITWDSSVASAPAAFKTAVLAAVTYLENQFTDAVTLNLSIGYGEVGGTVLGSGALGASSSYLTSVSYSSLRNAVSADQTSAIDAAAIASLPSNAPVSGNLWTTTAEAKALGLSTANSTSTDGFIGFSSTLPFTYDNSTGVAAGTYDFNGVALHEMTEVMGRMLLVGGSLSSYTNNYDLLDLFHYSAPGVRDFSGSTTGYFSVDGGVTNLGAFNTVSGGDAGDWAAAMGYNAFDAFSYSGVVNPVTANDLSLIDAIGWNRTTQAIVTGVAVAPITAGLAAAQTASGLVANAALARITQVGGAASDIYTYTLGGASAGAFTLVTTSDVATLAIGAAGLVGASGGALYRLTVTATDTTTGTSAAPSPLAVIVGGSSGETVTVATLTAALGSATPTFVFGLAGADTMTAAGMTGKLWFDGGAGADTMTGGTGLNDYLYTATSDSTVTAMDVITNFHAADLIDLSSLKVALNYTGNIAVNGKSGAGSIAAGSVGWRVTGGNTYVYVNTSTTSESLTAANMQIELVGSLSLTSSNIVHV